MEFSTHFIFMLRGALTAVPHEWNYRAIIGSNRSEELNNGR